MNTIATTESQPITLKQVCDIAEIMRKMPQGPHKVEHEFSHNVYIRTLHIPKGSTVVGMIHKFENFNMLIQGAMKVSTEDGVITVQAPFKVTSPPGTKRIAYAIEDCIWITVIGTASRDVDLIEEEFTARTESEYLAFCETLKIEGTNHGIR
jgi:hypothetical protein